VRRLGNMYVIQEDDPDKGARTSLVDAETGEIRREVYSDNTIFADFKEGIVTSAKDAQKISNMPEGLYMLSITKSPVAEGEPQQEYCASPISKRNAFSALRKKLMDFESGVLRLSFMRPLGITGLLRG
jgi:hypothetical protein